MDKDIALALIELVTVHGVTAVKDIIAAWKKDTVTLDDIKALKEKIKRPEEY